MDQILLNWLRKDSIFTYTPRTATTAIVRFGGANPTRWMIWISSHATDTLTLWFGDQTPAGAGFVIAPNSPGILVTEDTHGGLVQQQFWVSSSGASSPIYYLTVFYQIESYRRYERIYREFISKYQPS